MCHNEALAVIDIAIHAEVVAAMRDTPPETPEPGQCWIVGGDPAGDWAGHANALAGWTEAGWRFVAAREGLRAWVTENQGFALFSSGEWRVGESHGRLIVAGIQVVGAQAAAIAEPAGGGVADAEARMAISEILSALRAHGLIASG